MASSSHDGTPPLAAGVISKRARIAANNAVETACVPRGTSPLARAGSGRGSAAMRGRTLRVFPSSSSTTGTTSACATVPTLTPSHATGPAVQSVPAPRRSAASASARARTGSSTAVPAMWTADAAAAANGGSVVSGRMRAHAAPASDSTPWMNSRVRPRRGSVQTDWPRFSASRSSSVRGSGRGGRSRRHGSRRRGSSSRRAPTPSSGRRRRALREQLHLGESPAHALDLVERLVEHAGLLGVGDLVALDCALEVVAHGKGVSGETGEGVARRARGGGGAGLAAGKMRDGKGQRGARGGERRKVGDVAEPETAELAERKVRSGARLEEGSPGPTGRGCRRWSPGWLAVSGWPGDVMKIWRKADV